MASKTDLIRAGNEGFSLVEEYIVERPVAPKTTKVCSYQYQPQIIHVYQVKPIENRMTSYEVVQFRGGVAVTDYSRRKNATVAF
ncbi:hypothetical protein F511_39476 [Dorcoceras hygrometricum]|uniref:Uncharacterized protein n=1 Tax=Dorcoceras hygrometricum TaxID=472368 RepID=A0A2Z7B284_9LAMI|nr:hypothetical protein F511_39476 [Dorcoceras hygrometricum]